jgi:hypothetical protein
MITLIKRTRREDPVRRSASRSSALASVAERLMPAVTKNVLVVDAFVLVAKLLASMCLVKSAC